MHMRLGLAAERGLQSPTGASLQIDNLMIEGLRMGRSKYADISAGQKFNSWTVLDVNAPGNGKMLVICDCGEKRHVPPFDLVSGRSKSCGCKTKKTLSTGERFGILTVTKCPVRNENGKRCALLKCDCGGEKISRIPELLSGKIKSCGCNGVDLDAICIGSVFGRLTVSGRVRKHRKQRVVDVVCECGSKSTAKVTHLLSGNTKSCGCLRVDTISEQSRTHGMSKTPEYDSWASMKSRCTNPNDNEYFRYGARGISVCDEWLHDFDRFFSDLGKKPTPSHSIDRIDNDKDYSKDNCRWATQKEQARNRRTNRTYVVDGKTMSAAEIAEQCGIPRGAFVSRLNRGWTLREAMERPKDTSRCKKH